MRKLIHTKHFLLLIFALSALFTSCSQEEDFKPTAPFFSIQEQKTIGKNLRDAILKDNSSSILPENSCAYHYTKLILTSLLERDIVKTAKVFDWKIYIINDEKRASAFTLPGGYIFLSKGLFRYLDSENQIISVIAHEMAYADRGWVMDRLLEEYDERILKAVLQNTPTEVNAVAKALPSLVYAKETVKEADTYSATLVCPYSYLATGLLDIITKSDSNEKSIDWLDKHPSYDGRAEFLKNYISKACCHGKETFTERYDAFKLHCLELVQ